VLLEVHVGVLVSIDEFELELVDVEHCADVEVAQRVVLGELDRVAWLVWLLHTTSLQELAASEAYIRRRARSAPSQHGVYRELHSLNFLWTCIEFVVQLQHGLSKMLASYCSCCESVVGFRFVVQVLQWSLSNTFHSRYLFVFYD